MTEPRLSETGYKRKHQKVCTRCKSPDLDYTSIKNWVKCVKCGKLYSQKYDFDVIVE